MTKAQEEEFGFEPFADTPVYQQLHRNMIKGWLKTIQSHRSTPMDRILDLATGKGTIPRLVLENWPREWPMPELTCLDQTNAALTAAREELKQFPSVNLKFVEAPIESFSLPAQNISLCTWGNGIHYLDAAAQEQALTNIKAVLPPGGWFAFNTAFHMEGRPKKTYAFYNQQVRIAVRSLAGIQRDKSIQMPAAGYLSRSHYEDLLQRLGFELMDVQELFGPLDQDAMEKISGFQHYAAGALRGYPPEPAAKALKAAVAPAMEAHGERDENGKLFVDRRWLAIAARRVS